MKAVVDEIEFLLGSIHELRSEQVRYLRTYDLDFARYNPGRYEPEPDAAAEAEGDDPVPEVGFGPETERRGDETAPL